MKKITIVGGGQSGLQLGVALLAEKYEVKVVTNRDAADIRSGRVLSSQCMFNDALDIERGLGLNFWDEDCPNIDGIGLEVFTGGEVPAISWKYRLDAPAQSTDQRVKIPVWMNHFEEMGGELIIHDAEISDLEHYSKNSDLVIVASGKGEISAMFERDAERSEFDRPQRALALTYVHGMKPQDEFSRVGFNIMPGIGEYFSFPALTTSGPCDIMVFEGVVGGEMDCWKDVTSPAEHLQRSKDIVNKYLPAEAARLNNIELTDDNGILAGRFPPTVRKPIGRLPSGASVLGMADAVILSDPITGQGSNNASKCCAIYLKAILEQGDKPFDEEWMQSTFEQYWDYAKYVATWTANFLKPVPEHVLKILAAAEHNPAVGADFVNGFNHPPSYFPWISGPEETEEYLGKKSA